MGRQYGVAEFVDMEYVGEELHDFICPFFMASASDFEK